MHRVVGVTFCALCQDICARDLNGVWSAISNGAGWAATVAAGRVVPCAHPGSVHLESLRTMRGAYYACRDSPAVREDELSRSRPVRVSCQIQQFGMFGAVRRHREPAVPDSRQFWEGTFSTLRIEWCGTASG